MTSISVLLPYRDAAATLAAAVDCVLAQRDVDLELIAIDDGSRDDGPAWIAAAARRDPRVRAIASGGVGVAGALDAGLAASRGAWIARMDADDLCAPDRLRRQLDALIAAPGVGALGTAVALAGLDGGAPGDGLRRYVAWQNALITPADHARELLVEAPLCHPSVMLRRDALRDAGGWREVDGPEDYALWLRLHAAGWQLAKLAAPLFTWRHRAGRVTFTDPRCAPPRLLATKAPFVAAALRARARPFVIWGAGPTGKRLARALEPHGLRPAAFLDIDPRKIGRTARGAPVRAAADVPRDHTVVVAVGAAGARAQICDHARALGVADDALLRCA